MPIGLKCNCKGDSANIHPSGKGVTLGGGGGGFAGPGCIKEEIIWQRSGCLALTTGRCALVSLLCAV